MERREYNILEPPYYIFLNQFLILNQLQINGTDIPDKPDHLANAVVAEFHKASLTKLSPYHASYGKFLSTSTTLHATLCPMTGLLTDTSFVNKTSLVIVLKHNTYTSESIQQILAISSSEQTICHRDISSIQPVGMKECFLYLHVYKWYNVAKL